MLPFSLPDQIYAQVTAISAGNNVNGGIVCTSSRTGELVCYGQDQPIGPISFSDTLGVLELGMQNSYYFGCAIFTNKRVRCWGILNEQGQLGLGIPSNQTADPKVASVMASLPYINFAEATAEAVQVATGRVHACVLFISGRVRCWGWGIHGILGTNSGSTLSVGTSPTDMTSLQFIIFQDTTPVVQLAAGGGHTCARFVGGALRCWGLNKYGQLGINSRADVGVVAGDMTRLGAIKFSDSFPATHVSAGVSHTCATFSNGRIRCWGWGAFGQLGYGSTSDVGVNPGEMERLAYVNLFPPRASPAAGSLLGGDLINVASDLFIIATAPPFTVPVRFTSVSGVCLHDVNVTGVVHSNSSMTLRTPSWPCAPGVVSATILLPMQTSFDFTFYDPAFRAADFASPFSRGGPIEGGSNVSLSGMKLIATPNAVCHFWNNHTALNTTTLFVTSETSAFCSSPEYSSSSALPFSAEKWDFFVEISLNGINFTSGSGLVFHYYHVRRLDLDVKSGPALGATPFTVRITAYGNFTFALPHASVYFNSSVCGGRFDQSVPGILISDPSSPSGFSVNASSVRLDSQKLSLPANFSLTVSFNNAQFSSHYAIFKYYFDPSVIRFDPPGAPLGASRDVNITIMGSNFADPAPSTSCTRMTLLNGTTLDHLATFVHPDLHLSLPFVGEANAGRVVIEVSFNGGVNYTSSNQSIYLFMLMQVDPSGGPLSGGTLVTITGRGFDPSLPFYCLFCLIFRY
jgi:hypothetical protein